MKPWWKVSLVRMKQEDASNAWRQLQGVVLQRVWKARRGRPHWQPFLISPLTWSTGFTALMLQLKEDTE